MRAQLWTIARKTYILKCGFADCFSVKDNNVPASSSHTHAEFGSSNPIVKGCHIHTVSTQYLAEAERSACPLSFAMYFFSFSKAHEIFMLIMKICDADSPVQE